MTREEAQKLLAELNVIAQGVPSWTPPEYDTGMPMHGNSADPCVNPPAAEVVHKIISSRLR